MEKQQLINLIKEQLATGNISAQDLLQISETEKKDDVQSSSKLIKVFYIIGTIIAIIGVIILLGQNWLEIGLFGRISVTLGISIITFVAGLIMRKSFQNQISQVLLFISAILAPFGIIVLLDEMQIFFSSNLQIITALALTFIYGFAFFVNRRDVLILIITAFTTWLYYSLILKFIGVSSDLLKFATIIAGFSYILVAYGYTTSVNERAIKSLLYFLGTLSILGAGISIGGIFDLIFIVLIFCAFYGSVFLKSRMMLILGSIFLMAHIIKLTGKYFADSIGWSLALIVIGFLVIGVGYMTMYVNKKYISAK